MYREKQRISCRLENVVKWLADLKALARVSIYLGDELEGHDADHARGRQHCSNRAAQLVALRLQNREVVPLSGEKVELKQLSITLKNKSN
jgi:hypothetical protein